MSPAEWAVEKEDRSCRDEAHQFRRVALKEQYSTQPQPIGACLCDTHESRLNFETDAAGTGFEMCEQCGPAETGSDIHEYVVAGHFRLLNGIQNGCHWARKVWHTAAREVGVVDWDLVAVPQKIEPRITVLRSNLRECRTKGCRADLADPQLRAEESCSAPKCRLHASLCSTPPGRRRNRDRQSSSPAPSIEDSQAPPVSIARCSPFTRPATDALAKPASTLPSANQREPKP